MEAYRLAPAMVITAVVFVLGTANAYVATDPFTGEEIDETQIIQMQSMVSELDGQVSELVCGYENLQDQIISMQTDLSGATEAPSAWNGMGVAVALVLGGAVLGVGMVTVVKRK